MLMIIVLIIDMLYQSVWKHDYAHACFDILLLNGLIDLTEPTK